MNKRKQEKKNKNCLLDSQKKLLSKTYYFVWYVFYLIFGEVFLLVLVPFCLHRFELHLTRANKTKKHNFSCYQNNHRNSLICYISKT